ncbi:MAG: NAD(P)/FAD-dependent oxidoreductase [Micromonosporaceae bacterium]|nr:NAD(P)/FAD-dependent oxidoreductase [Micromonosporaceae bacterium]
MATGAHAKDARTNIVVVGAGPAGLTAAYQLAKRGSRVAVVEQTAAIGGISQTAERDGWRFDIGGHRFFTKVSQVNDLWHEILPDEDFLLRPRMSRIYYRGKLFDYPLRAMNALRGLGLVEAVRCVGSYARVRFRPPRDQSHFEGWVTARFGERLYSIFFKTYTEKVWGVATTTLRADWAAQRIKNLSLSRAVINALLPKRNQKDITSLIEEFQYPKLGPGMMWERCAEWVEKLGGTVTTEARVTAVHRQPGRCVGVTVSDPDGDPDGDRRVEADHLISTMPLSELALAMDPPAPSAVRAAASGLKHRDFLTVALVVPEQFSFPDNWIYIHSPEVRVGRIQNFGSWSPYLVKDGRTCLGLEYFCNEGDELWSLPDQDLIDLGIAELERLGLVAPGRTEGGYVVRMPKAYPVYDEAYQVHVQTIRQWLATEVPNVHPIGRNGMHRYNNQDHSMLTALLAVENILDAAGHDVWAINADEEYHEEHRTGEYRASDPDRAAGVSTGRPT